MVIVSAEIVVYLRIREGIAVFSGVQRLVAVLAGLLNERRRFAPVESFRLARGKKERSRFGANQAKAFSSGLSEKLAGRRQRGRKYVDSAACLYS